MAFLIDTDVMVDVSRRNADAANYVDSLQDARIAIVTAHELIRRRQGQTGRRRHR